MNIVFIFFYNLLWAVVYVLTFPYSMFKRKSQPQKWEERFGNYTFDYSNGGKTIWIHGASVGEITASSKLVMQIRERFPERKIVISTMTQTGKERAMKIMRGLGNFVIVPFDFFPFVKKAIKRINPKTLILIETEIWPSLIFLCRLTGVKIVLANARLSDTTYKRYYLIRLFSKKFFEQINIFLPKDKEEEQKFLKLGVRKEKVRMIGSLKSDNSYPLPMEKSSLLIPSSKFVIVAGSVRKGEEEIVLQGFKRLKNEFGDTYLIIAPRHLNRVKDIENVLRRDKFLYRRRTEKFSFKGEDVLILDTIGELRSVYSVADIAFVGGTLLPYGGHNLIEPAFFGIPIIFGPYINNTKENARELLQLNCAIQVKGENDFSKTISYLFRHPLKRREMGENSLNYIRQKKGVVVRYIETLKKSDFL